MTQAAPDSPAPDPQAPVSAARAARVVGLTAGDIRAMVDAGILSYIILPGRRRPLYTVADVRAAIAERKRRWAENVKASSANCRATRTSASTGRSTVVDFEAELAKLKTNGWRKK